MQSHFKLTLPTCFLLFTLATNFFCTASEASKKHNKPQDLVQSSCIHTMYPRVCLRTLSNYAGPTNNRLDIAQASLKVSLAHARRALKYFKTLKSGPDSTANRQSLALSDCIEQMADSVEELKKSLEELRHLRPESFRWQMSNAETWVSAALTDGDSCLDGMNGGDDGRVVGGVKRRVTDVARVTSNALYMINRLGQGGSPKGEHRL